MAKKKTPPKKAAKKTPAASGGNGAAMVKERKDVPIGRIVRSPWQQRTDFPKAKVAELAKSIRSVGLLQPLIVRAKPGYRTRLAKADWELIAGECRWRACQSLGHKEIRVEVWDVDDRACRAMVAAENFKRNDLNAIEEARTFRQAIAAGDAPGPTELAKQYGLSQGHVSNRIRLLGLPEKVQAKIISHEIPPTHARQLVPLKDHPKILDAIVSGVQREQKQFNGGEPLTVHEFENVVENVLADTTTPLTRKRYSQKFRGFVPAPKLTDEQRDELGIVELEGPGGKPEPHATNLDLWDKILDDAEKKGAKGAAAKRGNGKPRKLTAAEQKAADAAARDRAKLQAAQFRRRLWSWYVDWLRWLIARELRESAGQNDLILVLVLRGAKWYDHRVDCARILADAARAVKQPIRTDTANDLVGKTGDGTLFVVAREFAVRLFHDSDGPSPLVPDTDVGAIVKHLEIDVQKTWKRQQAGPVYSEAFWRLHTVDQLGKLARELGVTVDGGKKGDYVETFLSRIPATDTGKPAGLAWPKELAKIKRPR